MILDKQLLITSDNGIFVVETAETALNYPNETFYSVTDLAKKKYEIRIENGRIVSDMFRKVTL
jgi:hypothetical protein